MVNNYHLLTDVVVVNTLYTINNLCISHLYSISHLYITSLHHSCGDGYCRSSFDISHLYIIPMEMGYLRSGFDISHLYIPSLLHSCGDGIL